MALVLDRPISLVVGVYMRPRQLDPEEFILEQRWNIWGRRIELQTVSLTTTIVARTAEWTIRWLEALETQSLSSPQSVQVWDRQQTWYAVAMQSLEDRNRYWRLETIDRRPVFDHA